MRVIGIDPGSKGALVLIDTHLNIQKSSLMPLAGKEINFTAVAHTLIKAKPDLVILEKVHAMPKQGVSSTFKFGVNYGGVKGILEGARIPFILVTPQKWKKVLSGTAKDKQAAIDYIRRKYPNLVLIPKGKRTPQDGIADAACIADWYLQEHVK